MNIYADDGDDCASGQGQIQIGRAGWQPTHFAQVFFNLSPLCVLIKSKSKSNQNQLTLHRLSILFNFSPLCVLKWFSVNLKSKSIKLNQNQNPPTSLRMCALKYLIDQLFVQCQEGQRLLGSILQVPIP